MTMDQRTCPVCHEPVTGTTSETEILEMYDDGPGLPNDPRRLNTAPTRTMVPGQTVTTYTPCGHRAG